MAVPSAGNDPQHFTFVREGIQVPMELKRHRELEGTALHGGISSICPVQGRSSQAGNDLGLGHWLRRSEVLPIICVTISTQPSQSHSSSQARLLQGSCEGKVRAGLCLNPSGSLTAAAAHQKPAVWEFWEKKVEVRILSAYSPLAALSAATARKSDPMLKKTGDY